MNPRRRQSERIKWQNEKFQESDNLRDSQREKYSRISEAQFRRDVAGAGDMLY